MSAPIVLGACILLLWCTACPATIHTDIEIDVTNGEIVQMRAIKSPWNTENLSPDDIRCYCNLPVCVATSYMCRTARTNTGGCFTKLKDLSGAGGGSVSGGGNGGDGGNSASASSHNNINHKINGGSGNNIDPATVATDHGCVELLQDSDENRLQCDNVPRKNYPVSSTAATGNGHGAEVETLLLCCQDDMCNHVDNPEHKRMRPNLTSENNEELNLPGPFHPHYDANGPIDVTYGGAFSPTATLTGIASGSTSTSTTSNSPHWFRVATIAVPIFGAIFVFALVTLACRMLRTDGTFDAPTKSGNGCGGTSTSADCVTRKMMIDYEAYGNSGCSGGNRDGAKHCSGYILSPTRMESIAGGGGGSSTSSPPPPYRATTIYCGAKNEAQAKLNHLANLEYTLLPNSGMKMPNNTVAAAHYNGGDGGSTVDGCGHSPYGIGYRNINLSNPTSAKRNREPSDKNYQKEPVLVGPSGWPSTTTNVHII